MKTVICSLLVALFIGGYTCQISAERQAPDWSHYGKAKVRSVKILSVSSASNSVSVHFSYNVEGMCFTEIYRSGEKERIATADPFDTIITDGKGEQKITFNGTSGEYVLRMLCSPNPHVKPIQKDVRFIVK